MHTTRAHLLLAPSLHSTLTTHQVRRLSMNFDKSHVEKIVSPRGNLTNSSSEKLPAYSEIKTIDMKATEKNQLMTSPQCSPRYEIKRIRKDEKELEIDFVKGNERFKEQATELHHNIIAMERKCEQQRDAFEKERTAWNSEREELLKQIEEQKGREKKLQKEQRKAEKRERELKKTLDDERRDWQRKIEERESHISKLEAQLIELNETQRIKEESEKGETAQAERKESECQEVVKIVDEPTVVEAKDGEDNGVPSNENVPENNHIMEEIIAKENEQVVIEQSNCELKIEGDREEEDTRLSIHESSEKDLVKQEAKEADIGKADEVKIETINVLEQTEGIEVAKETIEIDEQHVKEEKSRERKRERRDTDRERKQKGMSCSTEKAHRKKNGSKKKTKRKSSTKRSSTDMAQEVDKKEVSGSRIKIENGSRDRTTSEKASQSSAGEGSMGKQPEEEEEGERKKSNGEELEKLLRKIEHIKQDEGIFGNHFHSLSICISSLMLMILYIVQMKMLR